MKLPDQVTTVRLVLESWPETRDDEALLLLSVWSNEMSHRGIKSSEIEFMKFSSILMDGELTPPSAILAIKKQLQENIMELRGDTYVYSTIGINY